tara:strand:+ start:4189 stop:4596 length:408 start_codon:yes stop_codon:yes gene_type:complete
MKSYMQKDDSFLINGTVINSPRRKAIMMSEVEAGEAEILPYVAPLPTEADYSTAIQSDLLDDKAIELGFDNIFTGVTYADEPAVPSFQAHGIALRAWRSLVWAKSYEIMAKVQAGELPMPSIPELLAMLPEFSES